ncbi:hypothetical protein ACH0C5_25360, partial [Escherichia coli]
EMSRGLGDVYKRQGDSGGQSNGLRYALSYLAKQDQKEHGIILMRSRLPEKSNRGRPRHN